jgi:hypothetical protein
LQNHKNNQQPPPVNTELASCPGVEPGENHQGLFFLFLEENPVRVWEIPKEIPEAFSLRKSRSRMTRVLEISSKFSMLYI